ncbi:hypothetical protein PV08_00027 [Exophiala spinifera]|uniref:Uncharacterized protein n=1 Tax=Exophiala spinifera TaxID=91928 RepID=A0A0D2BLL4_9EURO|nr:uncharacterized protein PV08_00027 [Exophiala spinifera]KIW19455.1 hypothetical protein PV08_00027 [Exophiala spinifera]
MTRSQGFQISEIPDLNGYVVIVTGGNSGIGYETTLQLAQHGARVYIAGRSPARVDEAITKMKQTNPGLDVRFLKLDLQDLQSVKAATSEFMQRESRLDILINNAGIMACPYGLTKDGYELQWQTCFLAPHAFTLSLLPLLKSTALQYPNNKGRVRVVNVASDAAFLMGPRHIIYDDPNMSGVTGSLSPWKRYGHCKLAFILATRALNDRLSGSGVTAYSLHPGLIRSNLQSSYPGMIGALARFSMKITPTISPQDGSRTSLYCATSSHAPSHAGRYFVPYGKLDVDRSKWVDDAKEVTKVWDLADSQLKASGIYVS